MVLRGAAPRLPSQPALIWNFRERDPGHHCLQPQQVNGRRRFWRKACESSVVAVSLRPRGLQPTRLLCPRDSPGKDSGVGRHTLLQAIFPTQGLNPSSLHLLKWQVDSFFFPCFLFIYFILLYLLYNTVLVLPYINMNLPRVYTCSQS